MGQQTTAVEKIRTNSLRLVKKSQFEQFCRLGIYISVCAGLIQYVVDFRMAQMFLRRHFPVPISNRGEDENTVVY